MRDELEANNSVIYNFYHPGKDFPRIEQFMVIEK